MVPSVPDSEPIMLGPPKSRQLNEPILVSLDGLVPKSHFYRHLERMLDLAFIRELVRELTHQHARLFQHAASFLRRIDVATKRRPSRDPDP
jgi:hypothetical protein